MKMNIDLDTDSIEKAIKELKDYRNSIDVKMETFMQRIAQEGYELVTRNISDMGAVYSGELLSSVSEEHTPTTAIIRVDNDHAAFVEFGTGPYGSEMGYVGELPDGWEYNVGEHIGTYIVNGTPVVGWWYYDDVAQRMRFTEGLVSRPFMFNSAQELKLQRINMIAKEVFGHD